MKKRLLLFCLFLITGLYGSNKIEPIKLQSIFSLVEQGRLKVEDRAEVLEDGTEKSSTILDATNKELISLEGLLAVPDIEKVETIDLRVNHLEPIPREIFAAPCYVALRKLYLQSNSIRRIMPGTFEGLSELEVLSLAHNKITSLETGSLGGLNSLTELYLEGNRIESIRTEPYKPVAKTLKKLVIYGNPIFNDRRLADPFLTLMSLSLPDTAIHFVPPFFISRTIFKEK